MCFCMFKESFKVRTKYALDSSSRFLAVRDHELNTSSRQINVSYQEIFPNYHLLERVQLANFADNLIGRNW